MSTRIPRAKAKEQFELLADRLTKEWQASKKPIKAEFPKGYIRCIGELRQRWPYLTTSRARTVACTIQLCDINRWNLNVWRIELTAGTLWEWHAALPVVFVIETLCREFALQRGFINPDTKFQKTLNTLHSKGVLPEKQWKALDALREYRNAVHLHLREKVEMHDGLPRRYNQAVLALHQLESRLNEYSQTENCPF